MPMRRTGSSAWCGPSKEERKQQGISFLLIDLATPGIEVRPIRTIDGYHHRQRSLFRRCARACRKSGRRGRAWLGLCQISAGPGADFDGQCRLFAPAARPRARLAGMRTAEASGALIDDPAFRRRLTWAEIELKALEITQMRVVAGAGAGRVDPKTSILKIKGGELLQQAAANLLLDTLGPEALTAGFRRGAGPDRVSWSGCRIGDPLGLFQLAQIFDLRRFERNSAKHPCQAVLRAGDQAVNFDPSEEQVLLADMASKLFGGHAARDPRDPQAEWRDCLVYGLIGLPFPDSQGGFGGGHEEVMLVMESMGRHLSLAPYLQSVLLAGRLLARADRPELQRAAGWRSAPCSLPVRARQALWLGHAQYAG